MRNKLDLPVLQAIVHLICDGNDSFSAYDITTLVRKRLPSAEIVHDEVRLMVQDYAAQNGLVATNAGNYIVFSKTKQVTNSVTRSQQIVAAITSNSTPVAKDIVKPVTTQSRQDQIVNAVTSVASNKSTGITVIEPVRSEGRIKLHPSIKQFKNAHIRRENNRIVILDKAHKGFDPMKITSDRIRTGFNSNKAKVVVHKDWAEIVPA